MKIDVQVFITRNKEGHIVDYEPITDCYSEVQISIDAENITLESISEVLLSGNSVEAQWLLKAFNDGKGYTTSGEAKDLVVEYLDDAVAAAVKELINKLPRKSKGSSKGELKRITLQKEDFN